MKTFFIGVCLLLSTTYAVAEPQHHIALALDGSAWAKRLGQHFNRHFIHDTELPYKRSTHPHVHFETVVENLFIQMATDEPGKKIFFVNLQDFNAPYAFRYGFPQNIYTSPFAFEVGLMLTHRQLFAATRWFDGMHELDLRELRKRLGGFLPSSSGGLFPQDDDNKYYPMSLPSQGGGAFEKMLTQSQFVYVHEKEELLSLLANYREQFKQIASRKTAFSPEAYDREMQNGGNPLAEHCGAATFVIQRLHGGEAVLSQYVAPDGEEIWHMWNRLPVANSIELLDVDLTKGQFDLNENNFDPPGESFVKHGKVFTRKYMGTYQWEGDNVNPLRPEIMQFFTGFLTRGQIVAPRNCEQTLGN